MSELSAEVELPDGNGAASAARGAVRSVLIDWDFRDEEWLYGVTLIVSELVTNAVRHGGGCLSLRLHAGDGGVSVAVADRSTTVPRRRHADERSIGGRGLTFVEEFAQDWGVRLHRDGKHVWVRLAPHPR